MTALRVLTINIWNRQGPWEERKERLISGIAALEPDIVGMQEVIRRGSSTQAHELVKGIGHHVAFGKARPLEDKAVQGLAFCLNKSTELSWYNEWSGLCESELNQIKPAQFPLATEIRAEPGYLTLRPAAASVLTEIK